MGDKMKEVVYNTAIKFTKKELIMCGIGECIQASVSALLNNARSQFADLILQDLKDENNNFQFVLTIKRLDE